MFGIKIVLIILIISASGISCNSSRWQNPLLDISRLLALEQVKNDIESNRIGIKGVYVAKELLDFTSEIFFFSDSIVRNCGIESGQIIETHEGSREALALAHNGLLFFSENEGDLFVAELFPIEGKKKFLMKDKPVFGNSYLYLFCEEGGRVSLLSKIMLIYN